MFGDQEYEPTGSEVAHKRTAFVDDFPYGLAVVEVTVSFHGKSGKVGECLALSGAGLPDLDAVGQLVEAAASGLARLRCRFLWRDRSLNRA
ncbi:hypothetical protein ACFWB2_12685 [Streptomyces virginiae]|uniref:hypothetical protein n=1 Tax=Streptomyces virginiae TaxID=1961 RepID=UPI0036BC7492